MLKVMMTAPYKLLLIYWVNVTSDMQKRHILKLQYLVHD